MQITSDPKLNYLELFAFPLRGTALFTLLGVSLLLWVSQVALLFGIWLGLLTTIALLHYVFVIIRHSALGHKEPPPLSPADFNPADAVLPVITSLLLVGASWLIGFAGTAAGYWAGIAVAGLWIVVLPAILSTLALERSLERALNPLNIVAIVRGFGSAYWPMVGMMLAALGISAAFSAINLPQFFEIAVGVYALFLMAYSVGRITYESRERIGLDVLAAPETREEIEAAREIEDHKRVLDEAYQLARTDYTQARDLLDQYQQQSQLDINAVQWIFDRLQSWDDPKVALWFARHLVARRATLGQPHEALKTCLWALGVSKAFRPQGPEHTYLLGKAAIDSGQFRLGTALLHDYATRFPDDNHAIPAVLLAANAANEHLKAPNLVAKLTKDLVAMGVAEDDERLQRLRS